MLTESNALQATPNRIEVCTSVRCRLAKVLIRLMEIVPIVILLGCTNSHAKLRTNRPHLRSTFVLKELGLKAAANPYIWVRLSCFSGKCTWVETRLNDCFGRLQRAHGSSLTNFIYTNTNDDHIAFQQFKIVENPPGTLTVELPWGGTVLKYVLKVKCYKSGSDCKATQLTGSVLRDDPGSDSPIHLTYEMVENGTKIPNVFCSKD